jgi:CSLREA domain-containing protein
MGEPVKKLLMGGRVAHVSVLVLLGLGGSASAATITVDDTNDEINADGSCSLREAIQAANTDVAIDGCTAGDGADSVVVSPGTYTLAIAGADEDDNLTGDLDINSDIVLTGDDWQTTVIDADGIDRVLHVTCAPSGDGDDPCLGVTQVTVRGLTLRNGNLSGFGRGAGLYNTGAQSSPVTTVDNCRLTGNTAGDGGAVGNEARLFLRGSSVDGNTSTGDGGGISNISQLLIEDTRVSNNECAGLAGGIYNNGNTTVRRSLIDGNTAGNDGGGYTDRNGASTFVNVSMVGNHSGQTGGAYSCGFLGDTCSTQFSHCTISDNSADAGAGGLAQLNGSVALRNTLVARNGAEDVAGGFSSSDYNLIQNVGSATGFVGFHDQLGVLPLLAPGLADNGGPLQTLALLPGSPAIDAGTCAENESEDQRGAPRAQGGACDIGAFEVSLLQLIETTPEPAGVSCAAGGTRIDIGRDANVDGILQPEELAGTHYACDGADGQGAGDENGADGVDGANGLPGADGDPSVTRFTDIPFGDERCPTSGRLIEVGADRNGNSALDPDEVQTQSLLCLPNSVFISDDSSCSLSSAPRHRSGLSWAACLPLLGVVLLRLRRRSPSARLS